MGNLSVIDIVQYYQEVTAGETCISFWTSQMRNTRKNFVRFDFEYSAPLAETVLLGNVVARAGKGKTLIWNGSEVTNDRSANAFLRTTYRDGWELKG